MTYHDYQQNGEFLECKFINKIIAKFILQEKLENEIEKISVGYNVSDALSYNFCTPIRTIANIIFVSIFPPLVKWQLFLNSIWYFHKSIC